MTEEGNQSVVKHLKTGVSPKKEFVPSNLNVFKGFVEVIRLSTES